MKVTLGTIVGVLVLGLFAGLQATGEERKPVAAADGYAKPGVVNTADRQVAAPSAPAAALEAASGERSTSSPLPAMTTQDLDSGLTPEDLVNALLAPASGAVVSNVTFTGANNAAGLFSGAPSGLAAGVILSTGNIASVVGPVNSSR